MNIIQLSPHSDPQAHLGEQDAGGQCVYEHQLSYALSHYGNHDVTVYCRDSSRRPRVSKITDTYRIIRIPCGGNRFIAKEDIEPVLGEFAARVVKDPFFTPDAILHAHYWDGGKAAIMLKSLITENMPFVWTPHSLGITKRTKFPDLQNEILYNFIPRIAWENYTMHVADKIIWSIAEDRAIMNEYYGVDPDKIEIVEPGIDVTRLSRINPQIARAQLTIPDDGYVLLTLGRMTPSKRYEHAIDALSHIQSKKPIYLVICGGNYSNPSIEEKEYMRFLKKHAREQGVSTRVIFIPAVSYETVNTVYSAADVFILTSPKEPHGLTVLEAMSMGIPSVVSRNSGIANRITHAKNSMLVSIETAQDVASAITQLLKNKLLYQRISHTARDEIRTYYHWRERIGAYERVYRSIWRYGSRIPFRKLVLSNFFLSYNIFQTDDTVDIRRPFRTNV
ncbi:glycosyltransferase [Candidatus Roizmanbacteria bacterium]|nr:glycosyltransferase [Candidatus Roizmanbacteria bacterium]